MALYQDQRIMAHKECLELYGQVSNPSAFDGSRRFHWKDGDIGFLSPEAEFNDIDWQCLTATGYLPKRATGHPVVILNRPSDDSTHVIIATVSAFGASKGNGNLPPWKNRYHSKENRRYFRAFDGSEKPNQKQDRLHLQDEKRMPKSQSSWVYIQYVYVVPITTLKNFNKSHTRLRMTEESLSDLCGQMVVETENIINVLNDPRLHETISNTPLSPSAAGALQRASSAHFPLTRLPDDMTSNMHINPSMVRTAQSMSPAYFTSRLINEAKSNMSINPNMASTAQRISLSKVLPIQPLELSSYPALTPPYKMQAEAYYHNTGFYNPSTFSQGQRILYSQIHTYA
jgi:hypothetical protein